jgi:class I fructose-bisphosphate aldolase
MTYSNIEQVLGADQHLLTHPCKTIDKQLLHTPSPNFIDRVFLHSNRTAQVLKSLKSLFGHGRLAHTGYLSILPVDQGVEHTAGASFASNPLYFDPENIMKLALEGGCNGVATTLGTLAIVSRKYAHQIPFIAKINHSELLTYPNRYNQVMFGSVQEAWNLGATAVGATIYFGAAESSQQLQAVSQAFEQAHALGMATILWCYTRNSAFQTPQADYHLSADITGQANYLGATIQADIIKQKLPTCNEGFLALNFGKADPRMYAELASTHPIDLCRYQVANCYMGRVGLLSSGGGSKGAEDLSEAIKAAVINKRAGGMGLISGRKAFQRPFKEGIALLHAIQDVYLEDKVGIA